MRPETHLPFLDFPVRITPEGLLILVRWLPSTHPGPITSQNKCALVHCERDTFRVKLSFPPGKHRCRSVPPTSKTMTPVDITQRRYLSRTSCTADLRSILGLFLGLAPGENLHPSGRKDLTVSFASFQVTCMAIAIPAKAAPSVPQSPGSAGRPSWGVHGLRGFGGWVEFSCRGWDTVGPLAWFGHNQPAHGWRPRLPPGSDFSQRTSANCEQVVTEN